MTDKIKSNDRIIVLEPIEGEEIKSSKGMADPRLWKGGNELHAVMDNSNCTWRLKYKAGAVPPPIQGIYTNFPKAFKAAEEYYFKRGLRIVEVKD